MEESDVLKIKNDDVDDDGVPKGSTLNHLLFNLFLNDISDVTSICRVKFLN